MGRKAKAEVPKAPAMIEMEAAADVVAEARHQVAAAVALLKEGLRQIEREHVPDLRRLSKKVGVAHEKLMALIKANPTLFVQPKSAKHHDVQFGYRKQIGAMKFDDEKKVIERIAKKFPEQLDTLAPHGPRAVLKTELEKLPGADLKTLGVEIEKDSDKPFIRLTDDATDKLVAELLKGYTEEPQS